ncbi:hypothetical protein [Halovivax sp.]|uniref:DUF7577 domain-containing protein n=1 Tax=Halovivax sp. TaxID=1935978 RepID=UPI0025B8DF09|nr:hypothetical protein [Halovivax sp.]
MELWGWLAGYVLLFALLHLALYYYYVRRDGDDRPTAPSLTDGSLAGTRYGTPTDSSRRGAEDVDGDRRYRDEYELDLEGETVDCAHCGAPNESDSTFTYCWNCISTLRR